MLKKSIMHRNMKKKILPWLKSGFSHMEMSEDVIYLIVFLGTVGVFQVF